MKWHISVCGKYSFDITSMRSSVRVRRSNVMSLQSSETAEVHCPSCSRCGQNTRIYGIEPHSQYTKTDIRTYVCDGCETVEVRLIPTESLN